MKVVAVELPEPVDPEIPADAEAQLEHINPTLPKPVDSVPVNGYAVTAVRVSSYPRL